MGQTAPRRLLSDSAVYLGLSATQVAQLLEIDATLAREHAALEEKARRSTGGHEAICRDAASRQSDAENAARTVLSPEQQARLAALEQAFALMPVIESAQRAHLLKRTLSVPPAGLPEGTIAAEIQYQRAAPPVLPGCTAARQTVRPGVVVEPGTLRK